MIRAGLTILAGAILAAGAAAQSQPSAPPAQTPAPPADVKAQATQSPTVPNGPAVNVELNSSLDSKKAKVGDKVEAKTTEPLKSGNDVVVPKGTKLIGHVTEATARSKGDNDSTLAIQFDKAVPKKEQEIPLNAMIIAIAPPAQTNFGSAPSPGAQPDNPSSASAQGSPMGRPQSSPPSNASPTNYPTSGSDSSDAANAGSPGATGLLPANSRGVYGLKDLKLMMNSKANSSPNTVITSTGKDVRLDSGTRMLLISQTPAGAPSGQ